MVKKKVSNKGMNKNLVIGIVVVLLLIGVFWYFNNQKDVGLSPEMPGSEGMPDGDMPGSGIGGGVMPGSGVDDGGMPGNDGGVGDGDIVGPGPEVGKISCEGDNEGKVLNEEIFDCKYETKASDVEASNPRIIKIDMPPYKWECNFDCRCWFKTKSPASCKVGSLVAGICPDRDIIVKSIGIRHQTRPVVKDHCNDFFIEDSEGNSAADLACIGTCRNERIFFEEKDPFDKDIIVACCVD